MSGTSCHSGRRRVVDDQRAGLAAIFGAPLLGDGAEPADISTKSTVEKSNCSMILDI
jgi:hypothetical protein